MANKNGGPDEHLSYDGEIRKCSARTDADCTAGGKGDEPAIPVPQGMDTDTKAKWREATMKSLHGQHTMQPHKKESTKVKVPTLAEIMKNPTSEDFDKAKEHVLVQFSNKNHRDAGWDKLMPPKSRMTDKNTKEYYRRVEEVAAAKIDLRAAIEQRAKIYAEMSAYGRAFTQGVEIPQEKDAHFEKMWEGKADGLSETQAHKELASRKRALEDLLDGRITPGSIVGSGYKNPKKVAVEYLTGGIEEYSRAIETKGRSYSINVANAEYTTRANKNKITGIA